MHETTLTPESVIRPAEDNTGMVYIKVQKLPTDEAVGAFRRIMGAPNAFAFRAPAWREAKESPYCGARGERTISAERTERAVEQDDYLRLAGEAGYLVFHDRKGWACTALMRDPDGLNTYYETMRAAFWACRQREAATAKTRAVARAIDAPEMTD